MSCARYSWLHENYFGSKFTICHAETIMRISLSFMFTRTHLWESQLEGRLKLALAQTRIFYHFYPGIGNGFVDSVSCDHDLFLVPGRFP